MLSGCFFLLFGTLLLAFWEPLGAGLLELLGSCGKDLGCLFVFFIRFFAFIQPVLSNVGECRGLGGWGGGGRWALHMLCKGFSVVPHGFYICLESFLN